MLLRHLRLNLRNGRRLSLNLLQELAQLVLLHRGPRYQRRTHTQTTQRERERERERKVSAAQPLESLPRPISENLTCKFAPASAEG